MSHRQTVVEEEAHTPVLVLGLTALAALAIGVSGCVIETHSSRVYSDVQPWIGLPVQDVVKRFGESERVTGGTVRQKYVQKKYEDCSHDHDYTYYEQDHGNALNSSILSQKTGAANQSGYYTCIHEFSADASGRAVDVTARGKYRQLRAPFAPQRAIGSASHHLVSDAAEMPESNAEASPPLAPP